MAGLVDTSDLLEMAGFADEEGRNPFPVVPDLIQQWSKFHNNRRPISDLSDDSTRSNINLIQSILDKVDKKELAGRARKIDLSSTCQTEILVHKDLSIRQGRSAPVVVPWRCGDGEDPKQGFILLQDHKIHDLNI